jgi:Spy/CpxP family protein refolding chaperone
MKSKWFVIMAILAFATVTVFVTDQVTQAQRPDRGEMRNRPGGGGGRGGPGGGGGFSPTSVIDSSWTDLTFSVKVDDKTLIKARPVYQKSRDDLEKAIEDARAAGDFGAMRETMMGVRDSFKSELKKVLTEDQIAKLDKLEQERGQRMNRGGGRQRRDGGGGGGGGGRQ